MVKKLNYCKKLTCYYLGTDFYNINLGNLEVLVYFTQFLDDELNLCSISDQRIPIVLLCREFQDLKPAMMKGGLYLFPT